MNTGLDWIARIYARILRIYPSSFQEEFAAEMQVVFENSVQDAAENGAFDLMQVCVRELMLLPFNILREFWFEVRKARALQLAYMPPIEKGTWKDALLAGLPHLVLALIVGILGLIPGTRLATMAAGVILATCFLVGFLITIHSTWRDGWKAWSASWYGYAALIVFLLAILPAQNWNPPLDKFFNGVGSRLLLLLGLSALLYWLTRRNAIEGLLMAMPLIILYWLPTMEFIPNQIRFWLTFGVFLLAALTAMTITRINKINRAVWIVLGASILSGLPIAYARTYWHNIPEGYFSPPTFSQMIELFSVQFLAGTALALAPILGWGIWNLGKRYQRAGRVAAGLTIFGVSINLFGQFSYWQWFSHLHFFNALGIPFLYRPDQLLSAILAGVGLVGAWVGVILLAIPTWEKDRWLSIALVFVPLLLPLFSMFPIYFGYQIVPPGLWFEFSELSQAYRYLIFLVGAAWLVMSGWTVACLHNDPPPLRETE